MEMEALVTQSHDLSAPSRFLKGEVLGELAAGEKFEALIPQLETNANTKNPKIQTRHQRFLI